MREMIGGVSEGMKKRVHSVLSSLSLRMRILIRREMAGDVMNPIVKIEAYVNPLEVNLVKIK